MEKIKLNIGCGPTELRGYVGVDIEQYPHVKHNDPSDLPYNDGEVSEIYSSHLLSYYNRDKGVEVLKEWKDKADASTTMGTFIHKIFENYTMSLPYENSGLYQKEAVAIKFINEIFLTERLTPVGCEMIVYNDYLAGQIDNLSRDQKGNIYILDWKTNSEISRNNYGKSMLDKLVAIPDCAYYHYCLQLGIYKRLHGEVNDCFIIHLNETDYEIIPIEDVCSRLDLSFVGIN